MDLAPGIRYVISSGKQPDLPTAFANPKAAILVTEGDDPVSEMRAILAAEPLSTSQKIAEARATLATSTTPHGEATAWYLYGLVSTNPTPEGDALAQSIASASPDFFSSRGMRIMLMGLGGWVTGDSPRAAELESFATILLRYFCEDTAAASQGLTRNQGTILSSYLPWAMKNPTAAKALRDPSRKALLAKFVNQANQIAADENVPSQDRVALLKTVAALR
jgi:hypothetical protein